MCSGREGTYCQKVIHGRALASPIPADLGSTPGAIGPYRAAQGQQELFQIQLGVGRAGELALDNDGTRGQDQRIGLGMAVPVVVLELEPYVEPGLGVQP